MYHLKESLYFIPNCTYSFSSQSLLHQSFVAGCRHLSLGVFIFHLDPHPRVRRKLEGQLEQVQKEVYKIFLPVTDVALQPVRG